ncbi:MAG: hypothetical protein PVF83_18740 [Anaerolineales bacterium]
MRAYERRGPTFSDHFLLNRATLVDRIKSGKRFVTGRRIPNHGSEFEIADEVKLLETAKGETLISGENVSQNDHLKGVPVL